MWVQSREDDTETVWVQPREDDEVSLTSTTSTFSCVSFLPSVHSKKRFVERGISDAEIEEVKVRGRISLVVMFDDDYVEQEARKKALKWGKRSNVVFAGLSLGEAKPKGPPDEALLFFKPPKSCAVYLPAEPMGGDCGRRRPE